MLTTEPETLCLLQNQRHYVNYRTRDTMLTTEPEMLCYNGVLVNNSTDTMLYLDAMLTQC